MTGYVPALKVQPSATLYFSDTGSASGTGSLNKPFQTPAQCLALLASNARVEAIGQIATAVPFAQTAANQWVGTSVRMPSGRDLNLSTVNNAGFDRLAVSNAAINTSLTISGGTGHKFENCELASGATVSWTGIANGGFAVFRDCDLNSVTITLPSLGSNTASITFSRCSNVKVFGNTGWTVIFDDISGTVTASAGTVIALNSPNLRRVISGTAVDASMTASATLASSAPSTAGVYVLNYSPSGITEVTGATLNKGDMILYYGSSLALRVGAYESLDVVNIGGTTYIKDGSGGWKTAGAVTSVAGRTGAVTLNKSDVGLGNVDNTSDANKPISTLQASRNYALNLLYGSSITDSGGAVLLNSDAYSVASGKTLSITNAGSLDIRGKINGAGAVTFDTTELGNIVYQIYGSSPKYYSPVIMLTSGQTIPVEGSATAGTYVFVMQGDGNLVLYSDLARTIAVWALNILRAGQSLTNPPQAGSIAKMQTNGNFQVIAPNGNIVFQTGTSTAGSTLVLGTNGGVAVMTPGAGITRMYGINGYSGGSTINGGIVIAENPSAFGTGTITVNAGATLNKNGFALPNTVVNNGGTVIP